MPLNEPKEPWLSFLQELDNCLSEPVTLHCCGGFAMTEFYGSMRSTEDVDYLSLVPVSIGNTIESVSGRGSWLFKKYKLYLQHVAVLSAYPDEYELRLRPMFPRVFKNLSLLVLEAHDLALTKIERNQEIDYADVALLAKSGLIQPGVLKERYQLEMRPYLSGRSLETIDYNLRSWLEDFWPGEGTVP
jgi:hypothetical protein